MKSIQQQPNSGDRLYPRGRPPVSAHSSGYAEKIALTGRRQSRSGAPGYSRYVGRVGALAIALGVGAAIASMPGVAFADTAGSAGSNSSSSDSSSLGGPSADAESVSSPPDADGPSSDAVSEPSADVHSSGVPDTDEDIDAAEAEIAAGEVDVAAEDLEDTDDDVLLAAADGRWGGALSADEVFYDVGASNLDEDDVTGNGVVDNYAARHFGKSKSSDAASVDAIESPPEAVLTLEQNAPLPPIASSPVSSGDADDVSDLKSTVASTSLDEVVDVPAIAAPAPLAESVQPSTWLGSLLAKWLGLDGQTSDGAPVAPMATPLMVGAATPARRELAASATTSARAATDTTWLFGDGTAEHPDAGLLFGNGFSWDADSCTGVTACNGGNAGLWGGNGGHGFNGGTGGAAGWFGNGGNGGAGVPGGDGGDGGRGGLIAGNGGNGGDGGAPLLPSGSGVGDGGAAASRSSAAGKGGNGGTAGILGTKGRKGNNGAPPPITVGFPGANTYVAEGNSGARVELLTVKLSNPSATAVTVNYTVSGYTASHYTATAGEDFAAASGAVVFAPGQTSATIPVTVYGDTKSEPDEGIRVELTSAIGALIVLTPAEGQLAGRSHLFLTNDDDAAGIGMTLHYRGADAATIKRQFDLMAAMNVEWVRVDIDWSAVEPKRGRFNWAPTDTFVNEAVAHNMNVVFMLGFTPAWARSPATRTATYPTHFQPDDLADYAKFARIAAERYAPRGVRSWEIWNEPNTAQFWQTRPDADEYGDLFRVAATAIRGVDPKATLLIGGIGPQYDTPGAEIPPADYLEQLYRNGTAQLADGIAFHPYSFPNLPMDPNQRQIGGFKDLPALQSVMDSHGDGQKKIWITEFGAPTGSSVHAVSEVVQATMLLQAEQQVALWDWAGPLVYYELVDGGTDPTDKEQNFGVLRTDLTPKEAALALMDRTRIQL